jgi:hypothetical protein
VKPPAYITTSWDDGHPSDLRLADLLHKHSLRGTFYVPPENIRTYCRFCRLRRLPNWVRNLKLEPTRCITVIS